MPQGMVSARCGLDGMLYISKDSELSWDYISDMTFSSDGGEYHAFDITLFYRNVRINVGERVRAFLLDRMSA